VAIARREDGAWWIAFTCWGTGWAAAFRWTWEPLLLGAAFVSLLVAGQALQRPRHPILPLAGALFLPGLVLAWFIDRVGDEFWILPLVMPSLLYAGVIVARIQRLPVSRLLAVVALTAVAPATYGVARGEFGSGAAILWGALGGYFFLSSMFVIARLRRSRAALWAVRVAASAALVASAACPSRTPAAIFLSAVFLILAARTWLGGLPSGRVDPRRLGRAEAAFSVTSALLILIAVWLAGAAAP
jgi:hypothetical protein